jgi:hypothetical protein
MCFATPNVKPPPPVAPPPPPAPSATELAPAKDLMNKKYKGSGLDSLRIPLNPTGLPQQPRIGL